MTILAIETSCDETSAAVVRDGEILSNVVSSQIALHAEYGGVVPELAAREHLKNFPPVARTALTEAHVSVGEIDGVAATQGPGLPAALLVGFKAAQAVAFALRKPFIGVNHHEAHLYSPWIRTESRADALSSQRPGISPKNSPVEPLKPALAELSPKHLSHPVAVPSPLPFDGRGEGQGEVRVAGGDQWVLKKPEGGDGASIPAPANSMLGSPRLGVEGSGVRAHPILAPAKLVGEGVPSPAGAGEGGPGTAGPGEGRGAQYQPNLGEVRVARESSFAADFASFEPNPSIRVHPCPSVVLAAADFGAFEPNVSLIVSGGHTILVLVESELKHRVLGATVDDAAGECFDKTGKLIGLPYPAGPQMDKLAERGNPKAYDFPRPLLHDDSDDFSFSGLKTSVRYFLRDNPALINDAQKIRDLCASIQAAIVETLVTKTIRAALRNGVGCVTASGGVTCNRALRHQLQLACDKNGLRLRLAEQNLCTDNAGIIGILAERKFLANTATASGLDGEIDPGLILA